MDDLFAPTHLILIALIALLVFGPKKLPEIGSGLGRAIREFKQSFAGITNVPEDIRASVRAAGEPAAPAAESAAPGTQPAAAQAVESAPAVAGDRTGTTPPAA